LAPAEAAGFDDPWLDELARSIWKKPQFSMVPIDYEPVPRRAYAGRRNGNLPRVVFVGIPSDFGTAFLLHLLRRHTNLVAVVCSTRWQRTHPKADLLARIAGQVGIPVEVAANVNAPAFVRSLARYEPDVIVMASFDQILKAEPLAVPRLGWMNIHPSLLPRHRGPEPIYWSIVQGDQESGVTLHWTIPRVDAGPILAQARVRLRPHDTAGTLCKRIVRAGLGALDETLLRLEQGKTEGTLPDIDQGSYEPPVSKTELEWDQPFPSLERLVRAGQPDQPPFFTVEGERRYVTSLRNLRPRQGEQPGVLEGAARGEVLAATRDAVVVAGWRRVGHSHAVRPLRRQQFP
jgi:methionyl-tRNA formyltransferase